MHIFGGSILAFGSTCVAYVLSLMLLFQPMIHTPSVKNPLTGQIVSVSSDTLILRHTNWSRTGETSQLLLRVSDESRVNRAIISDLLNRTVTVTFIDPLTGVVDRIKVYEPK